MCSGLDRERRVQSIVNRYVFARRMFRFETETGIHCDGSKVRTDVGERFRNHRTAMTTRYVGIDVVSRVVRIE